MQSRHGIPSDSADKEEDVDQLRAELLEQVGILNTLGVWLAVSSCHRDMKKS